MTDITESAAAQHAALPSLASFRALSTTLAANDRADTADMARVAGEFLTDARRLRGLHGDAIVVAPTGSAEHELHVNLHACERSALAAQRRGVEALTARLRSDDELLASISTAAMADLESAAQSLLGASSLSDQLLASEASDGTLPPPPSMEHGELVVDITDSPIDLEYRASASATDELGAATEALAGSDWEERRAAILERVERARRPEPELAEETIEIAPIAPFTSDEVSPIIAAALASNSLQPERDEFELHPDPAVAEEPAADAQDPELAVEDVADPELAVEDVEEDDASSDDEVISVESRLGDLSAADAVVVDIADAPSKHRSAESDGLAEVIELQTEATAHEWPVWQGPNRSLETDVVPLPDIEVQETPAPPAPAAPEEPTDYPRLVSVAPEAPAPPVTPPPTISTEKDAGPTFSFAPQAPSDDMLPVPFGDAAGRKTQEEIAAEARALIADQAANQVEPADSFSRREVRRRQRRLRSHQRAVEKAESRVQRDRRRVELDRERSLAEESAESSTYAPTWFAQLAFAIAICLLVVMVAVGLWFLLADDPGLF